MTIAFYGFDGTMQEGGWRTSAEHWGARYGTQGFAPSKVVGVDRTIRFGTGPAYGFGITAVNSANLDVQLTALGVGNTVRWDTLVLRLNWSTNTGNVIALPGVNNAAAAALAATGKFADSDRDAGLADIPLAYAQAVSTSADLGAFIDLRPFSPKAAFWPHPELDPPLAWFPYGTPIIRDAPNGFVEQMVRRAGAWQSLTDPAWQALGGIGGIGDVAGHGSGYRVMNGHLELKGVRYKSTGVTTFASGAATQIGSVPPLPAPYVTREWGAHFQGVNITVEVQPGGAILATPYGATATSIRLDGARFSLR